VQDAQRGALRGEITKDLNPSPVAQSKLCKVMDEKPGRTPSLKEASPRATNLRQDSASLNILKSH